MNQPQQTKWYQYRPPPRDQILTGPFLLAFIVSSALLRDARNLPDWERALIALIPLPAFGWFVWRFIALMRTYDELQRRIQLEALAIAFTLGVAFLMTLGLLQTAKIELISGGYRYLWMHLAILYVISRGIAERRYR